MLLLGAAAVVQAWRIKAAAATCRVRLVFMTFHSLSPNEASAARQISTVQESKVMHSIQDSFLLNAHFH